MVAVNSIINQSLGFNNIELILVDDNSSDGTKDLLKVLSNNYNNIISIFLNENSGSAGLPRNNGLKIASADYIMFLDSDDFYYPEMCEKLYDTIINNNVDIVSSRFNYNSNGIINNPDSFLDSCSDFIKINSINDFPKIISVGFTTQLWNKIYKKQVILENNIFFPENAQNEDIYFPVKYYLVAKGIIILNSYYGYAYNVRNFGESISVTFKKENLINMTNGFLSIFNLLEEYDNPFLNFKGELLLGWTKWFLCTDLHEDKKTQIFLLNKTKSYYKNYSIFTRLTTVSLFFNVFINICYKLFGVFPNFIVFLSNFRNIVINKLN